MKKLFFAVVAALGVMAVLVQPASATPTWGSPVTITGHYMYDSGTLVYFKTSANANPESCAASTHLVLDSTAANFKILFSQLIAAYTKGDTIQVYYNGCSSGFPKISAIATPTVW